MKSTDLRQLIRESIQEYIREIDAAGDRAALEAKMKACEEAIALREKKSNMDGLDEAYHDMLDKGKIGELKKEIKALGKTLEKYKKQLAKIDGKSEPKKEKEDKEVIDETPEVTAEVDMNEYTADSELEEDQLAEAKKKKKKKEEKEEKEELNESFLYMQKLAGLITESEYQKKKQSLNEALEIEWSELGNDFTQAIQQIFDKTVKIQDAEVRYRPSSDTGKQPEFTFGVTIPSVGDKDNYKGALLYTNFLSDGNGFVGYDNYSKDKEATTKEFNEKLIPVWKKASAFVLGNLLKKPEELNKATVGSGYKYEEKDLEDLKKYVASIPNLAIKNK